MGKQFERVFCEQLKEYFMENFEEFRKTKTLPIDLIAAKQRFVTSLYGKIKKAFEMMEINSREDVIKHQVYEEESCKTFDETKKLALKFREETEKTGESDENIVLIRWKTEVLERKLDLIEEELNKRGIKIEILDGKVIFEEE